MLHKISVYLAEYLSEEAQKELDMAFVSVGQKYGFVMPAMFSVSGLPMNARKQMKSARRLKMSARNPKPRS